MEKETKPLKILLQELTEELMALKYSVTRLCNILEEQGPIKFDDRQVTMLTTAILRGFNNLAIEIKKVLKEK
jgi:hypothetical protein